MVAFARCDGAWSLVRVQYMTTQSMTTWHQPPNRFAFPPGVDYMQQNSFYYPNYNSINLLVCDAVLLSVMPLCMRRDRLRASSFATQAGLMEYPFFSASLPMELNLVAYGMVVGHELTHGFDNSGRLYIVRSVVAWR